MRLDCEFKKVDPLQLLIAASCGLPVRASRGGAALRAQLRRFGTRNEDEVPHGEGLRKGLDSGARGAVQPES